MLTDEKQDHQNYSRIDSKFLQSANFRFDVSNNTSAISQITLEGKFGKSGRSLNRTDLSGILKSKRGFGNSVGTPKGAHGKMSQVKKRGLEDCDADFGSENIASSDENNPICGFMKNYG
jgi:hypothetical protein